MSRNSRSTKSHKKETELNKELIRCVINDFYQCATSSVVISKLMEGHYIEGVKCNKDKAWNILAEAKRVLKTDFDDYLRTAQEQLFNSVMDLSTECLAVGDRSTALQCMKYVGNILGLDKINLNLSGEINENVNITFTSARKEDTDES